MANAWPIHGQYHGQCMANARPIHEQLIKQFMSIERPSNEHRNPNRPNGQQSTEPTETEPVY
eukprot:10662579-Lingulodinium_polyedra.AAC.1